MISKTYEPTPARSVAFLGLGVMGYPMAGHLKAKGHDVTVYNRTTAKADAEHRHKGQPPGIGAVDPRMMDGSGHSRARAASAAALASST